MLKRVKKGIVYVDDNLIIENIKAFDKAISALKENGLVLKDIEGLQDYEDSPMSSETFLEKFGNCLKIQNQKMLGMPNF